MATVYKIDGTKMIVTGTISKHVNPRGLLQLKQLQELVGGYIEEIPLGYYHETLRSLGHDDLRKVTIFANEEGRLRGLPPNPFFPGLVGDVVVLKGGR